MLQAPRLRSSFFALAIGLGAVGCGDDGDTSGSASSEAGGTGGSAPASSSGDGASTSSSSGPASSSQASTSPASSSSGEGAGGETGAGGDGGGVTTDGSGGDGGDGGDGNGGDGGRGGASDTGGGGGGPPECGVPEDCLPTGAACVARTCVDGVCGTIPIDDGIALPPGDQTPNDCKVVVCDGDGDTREEADEDDITQDADPCSIEICSGTTPDTEPAEEGLDCGGGLTCDGAGNCVGCLDAGDCPDPGECATRNCTLSGECVPDPVDDGTPLATQVGGNCQELQCNGAGGTKSVDDDADVPADTVDCILEGCSNGAPSSTDLGPGAQCDDDGGSRCNGTGDCVECLDVSHCPASTACVTYTCSSQGACIPDFADEGTPAGNPTAGDCRRDECDGEGNVVENVAYDLDVPVDASDCTANVCDDGAPDNPPLGINTPCTTNGGTRCNATGTCVQCNVGGQCSSNVCSSGVCVPAACNDGVRNGQETGTDCGGPTCADCPVGQGCSGNGDCLSGFCNPDTDLCATPTCNDGFANGNETDIDCGGSNPCTDCDLGFACNGNPDCLSNYCLDGFCSSFFCQDGTPNPPSEQCDDGDGVDYNGCDNDCRWTCGNGLLNPGEVCEDNDHDGGDGCSSTCAIEANWQCTTAVPSGCSRQEVRCNNSVDDDGDGIADATDPDCAWYNITPSQIPACAAGQTLYIFNSVRVPQVTLDNNTVTNEITVPDIGTVRRVILRINVTADNDADLDITLRSGANTSILVTSDNGSSGDNYTNTRFRQAATNNVTSGSAPFNNEYKPEGNFDGFNGALAAGVWRLTVTDDNSQGGNGSLNAFQLAICAN